MNAEVTVAACHSKMASASPAFRDLFVIVMLLKVFTLLLVIDLSRRVPLAWTMSNSENSAMGHQFF